jgi:Lecithin retinol acyltransferase
MAQADHIYVNRTGYVHHGIDCGDETVIHYDGEKISKIPVADFGDGEQYFVKFYGNCDRGDVVIQRAKSRLGESKYNLLFNNCEHFATWCKNGLSESEQVKNVGAWAGGVSIGGVTVAAGLGIVSAIGIEVGLSGAGIMSGLATIGGVISGGAVAGIGVLGTAPGIVTKVAMDQVLKDDICLLLEERAARKVGRNMTTAGAVAGTASAVGVIAASGSVAGLSAAGITSGLAAVGSIVGGGMAAGVAITTAAPAVAAAAVGYGAYEICKQLFK